MLNGLSKYSKNGAALAIRYFTAPAWKGRVRRPPPQVLVGNPDLIGLLCSTNNFSHKYTSGVLSFSVEETALIDAGSHLKEEILSEFEAFVFAGIADECRHYLAVEHRHMGRMEIHYLVPRIHSASGRYFNPFPPGYQRANDVFIDYMSLQFGLVNPRAPERARSLRVNPRDPAVSLKLKINDFILKSIEGGSISDAEDIKEVLVGSGIEIVRHGVDYISLGIPGRKKALRMKGGIYGRGFSVEKLAAVHAGEKYQGAEASREIEYRYKALIDKRAEFNQKRYKGDIMFGQKTTWARSSTETKREYSVDLHQAIENFSCQLRNANDESFSIIADCLSRDGGIDIASVMRSLGDMHSQMLMAALLVLIEMVLRFFGLTMKEVSKDDEAMLILSDLIKDSVAEVGRERSGRVSIGYGLYNNNNEVTNECSNEANASVESSVAGADRAESQCPGI